MLFKQDKIKESLLEFEQARELSPRDPLPPYHLALAFMKLGKPNQAKPAIRAALELGGRGFSEKDEAETLLRELGG